MNFQGIQEVIFVDAYFIQFAEMDITGDGIVDGTWPPVGGELGAIMRRFRRDLKKELAKTAIWINITLIGQEFAA